MEKESCIVLHLYLGVVRLQIKGLALNAIGHGAMLDIETECGKCRVLDTHPP